MMRLGMDVYWSNYTSAGCVIRRNKQQQAASKAVAGGGVGGHDLMKEEDEQHTKGNERSQDQAIALFPRVDFGNDGVDAGDIRERAHQAALDPREGCALTNKLVARFVRLRQKTVGHGIWIVDAVALVHEVVVGIAALPRLLLLLLVLRNVLPHRWQEVKVVPVVLQIGPDTVKFIAVLGQHFAVPLDLV